MLKFARIEMFYLLLLIPVIIAIYYGFIKNYSKKVEILIEQPLQKRVIHHYNLKRRTVKIIFLNLIILFLIFALINPQIGTRLELVKRKGVDIIVALDVSKSMLSTDISPSRIEKAKKEIKDLIDILEGDRIGIVCFSGDAFIQVPLTVDYAAVEMFLNIISPGIIPRPGTDISKAINLSLNSFQESSDKYKVIILMTDGEDHESDATFKAVEETKERNIKIYSIGFGSPEGSLVPNIDKNGNVAGYKKDKVGNYITSRLNDGLLRKISETTNGDFYYASSKASELDFIYEQIKQMEKRNISEREFTQFEDRFQVFLLIALILFIFEFFIYEFWGRKKHV